MTGSDLCAVAGLLARGLVSLLVRALRERAGLPEPLPPRELRRTTWHHEGEVSA